MNFIKNFIDKEISYFRKLHSDAQKLISSILLYDLISPLLGLFINAYLWRQSQDPVLVAIYNFAFFGIISIGFYVNGMFLNKFSPGLLYFLSVVGSGLAASLLIFFPTITYVVAFAFGLLNGFFCGAYWANRNLLTLKTTQSDNRIYFSSLESSIGTVCNVIVPLFIGWFISFGSIVHLYSPIQGYQIIAILMLFIVGALAFVMKNVSIKKIPITSMFIKKASKNWQQFQIFQFVWGLNEAAITFIPVLLVLILVGQEASLGTVQSASAVLTALITFAFAKYLSTKHRLALIVIGVAIAILGAAFLGIFYSALGVFILVATQNLSNATKWVGYSSLNYDLMDKDGETEKNHYAYVCDQEIYLNGGRIVGIFLFIVILQFFSDTTVLRYAPLLFGVMQIILISTFYAIEKNLTKHTEVPTTPSVLQ